MRHLPIIFSTSKNVKKKVIPQLKLENGEIISDTKQINQELLYSDLLVTGFLSIQRVGRENFFAFDGNLDSLQLSFEESVSPESDLWNIISRTPIFLIDRQRVGVVFCYMQRSTVILAKKMQKKQDASEFKSKLIIKLEIKKWLDVAMLPFLLAPFSQLVYTCTELERHILFVIFIILKIIYYLSLRILSVVTPFLFCTTFVICCNIVLCLYQ